MTPKPAVRFFTSISVGAGVTLLGMVVLAFMSFAFVGALDWLASHLGNWWSGVGVFAAAMFVVLATIAWVVQGREGWGE